MSSDHQIGEPSEMNKTMYVEQIKEDEYGNVVMDDMAHDGEIIGEEVLHEDMLGGDVEIEYVEDEGIINGEVILDGNGEEILEAEMATESLVALSQGSKEMQKELRNEYLHNVQMQGREPMRSPRILRRSAIAQRGFAYDQGTSRQASAAKPNFPVPAHTKRLLPVATLQQSKPQDWREAQKRKLEICEIYEVLPDTMRDAFKRILETTGEHTAIRSRLALRRYPSDGDYGDVPQETAARIYKEAEQLEQQHDEISHEHDKKCMEHGEFNDMPQLEEANDGDNQAGNDAQIDVEHYDSNDEAQMHENMQYIMDDSELVEMEFRDESSMKMDRRSNMLMPSMRDEYYPADANNYTPNQMIMNSQFQDSRYCPGCKLHLKRSIFYHHSRMIKKYGICNMFTPKRFPCGVPGCGEKLGTVEKLCEHMHQIHNAPTDIKTEVFSTQQEFETFLRELEAKGGNFRMSRGNKMIKTGMVQYFRCNRTQAMAKEKTMRICDEVGLFGEPVGSGVIDRPDDPFANPTVGGKPQLRTEEACTAFFRKAFLPDGSIEVRYCDHHLHEDERLRLPNPVKERIYEMHRKQLQPAVILMVLHEERENFALPGSAVERKLMTLTPKDISAVISTRNSNARKRNKAKQEGKNIAAECDQLVIDRNGPLTETEQKCLEQYVNNEQNILRDMAEMKRVENKRRHLRESIRNNVFHLGRYIRTSTFADMATDHLDAISKLVKEAAAITRMKSVHDIKDMEEDSKMIKNEKSPMMLSRSEDEMPQEIVDNQEYTEETVITDGHVDVIDGSYISHMEMPTTSAVKPGPPLDMSGHLEEQEQIIVEHEEPEPPAPKKKRGRRPRESMVKEEKVEVVYDPQSAHEAPLTLPSRTSRGRVVRPSRHFMDI